MSDATTPEFLIPSVRIDGPVRLVDPDPTWADQFARENERIRAALGERALQIEHAGSTSVPGLAAKPVIDIVLVVADSADESAYVPPLVNVGYRLKLREPSWHEQRLLVDVPTVQIHVFSAGSTEVVRMLRFRDRLRSNPTDRELYQRTKRELAVRHWAYVQDYANAKTSVIEAIMARADHDDH